MNQQNGKMGLLLAVLGAIAVLGLGFVFLIKPQLDAAASAEEERQLTVEDTDRLSIQLARVEKLSTEVAGWEEDLTAISAQMPSLPNVAELQQVLITAGNQSGVVHVESRFEAISAIDGADVKTLDDTTAAGAAPEAGGTEDGAPATAGPEDGSPAPVPVPVEEPVATGPVIEGLVALQFSVIVEGTPEAVMRFINILHTQQDRYITLSGLDILGSEGAEAAPGRPAMANGDWTATVNAVAFVIIDPTMPYELDETEKVAPYTGAFRNPFQPAGS